MKIQELNTKVVLPDVADLENVMNSILRISEVYNLSPDLVN